MVRLQIPVGLIVLTGMALCQEQLKKPAPLEMFQGQIANYLKVRKIVADQLPPLKTTPSADELATRKTALATSLAKARADVAQGFIFTPDVATEFRRLGKLALDGKDGARVHKSLDSAEPVRVPLRVNQPYPPAAALQSMPPTLLMGLPKLPKELEYRLVGRTLLLRDVEANLIVDFLTGGHPMSIARRQFLRNAGLAGPAAFFAWAKSASSQSPPVTAVPFKLPLKPDSTRFAIIGDSGTGEAPQFQIAQEMQRLHAEFPFEFVLMLGDNIYGNNNASAYKRKFEDPYQSLLKSGIKFYAALGNHDDPNQRLYKPFNMDGKRFYSFKKGDAEFFALDSTYMSPEQLSWIQKQLSGSSAKWKICFFHHPLYSNARFHGSDVDLRKQLEPLLIQYGANVVLNGHEHVYERLQPQRGVQYFVLGSSGQLRRGDLRPSRDTAKGFDADRAFALMEAADDELYFQVISARRQTVDSGVLTKMKAMAAVSGPSN